MLKKAENFALKKSENVVFFHGALAPILKQGAGMIFVPAQPSRSHSSFSLLRISVAFAQISEAKGIETFDD